MENDKTENAFLQELNNDNTDFVKSEELFADNSNVESGSDVDEEKSLPFHKDPKVQRYIQKELDKKLREFQPNYEQQFREETRRNDNDYEDENDDILVRLIGNDTPEKLSAIKDFKKYLSTLEERGARRALEELDYQAELERQEEVNATEEIENGFELIEDTFGVDINSNSANARRMRSDFIDFVKKISPKDEDGDIMALPDFVETFEVYQSTRQRQNTRAKELASRSMGRSSDTAEAPANRDVSWRAVDKWFSNLSK